MMTMSEISFEGLIKGRYTSLGGSGVLDNNGQIHYRGTFAIETK